MPAQSLDTLTMAELRAEAAAIAGDAERFFGSLSSSQLNWKPSPTQWSVAQCLEHLIHANRLMHGPIAAVIAGTYQRRWLERVPGLAGAWGRLMVKSLSPDATRKLKAAARATPSASAIPPEIVSRFIALQQETVKLFAALDDPVHTRVVITSPFLSVVVYTVLDACRIIVVHERRHFAQARRVIDATPPSLS